MVWQPGTKIFGNRYTIEKKLKVGGFGITYLVKDLQGQQFVLKTLKDEVMTDPEKIRYRNKFLRDFDRETAKIAICRHRHIVEVMNHFYHERLPCMVMEYIQGQDLWDRVLSGGALPEAVALRYIRQVGEALNVMHEKGLLHRDIKPQNIMVRLPADEAVLIDFGIAREFIPNLTQTHTLAYTPCFAPIEQYDEQEHRGEFTDVYALAGTLYYLLTGILPPIATMRVRRDRLDIPSHWSQTLQTAIKQGMAVEPEDRPQTVAAWLALLPKVKIDPVQNQPSAEFLNRVLELTNAERTQRGLYPLKFNPQLAAAAQIHSMNMGMRDFIDHIDPVDGTMAADRVTNQGYNFQTVAENVAGGHPTPEQVVREWMNSPAHQANILSPAVTEIGVGYHFEENDTGNVRFYHYWTQVFGTPMTITIPPNHQAPARPETSTSIRPPLIDPVQNQPSPGGSNLQVFSFETVRINRQGKIIQKIPGQVRFYPQDLGQGVRLDMVQIPGGTFLMGTEEVEIERLCKKYHEEWFKRESPQHSVQVSPFFLGKTPVTQDQWRTVVMQVGTIVRDLDPDPSNFKGGNRPVECVSWYDAVEWCARLSKLTGKEYRLPSEAEWEYACRAGTTTPFAFGEAITTDLANYNGNYTVAEQAKGQYRKETTPVASFPPNSFGLYDLHGNVWERCFDPFHQNYQGAPRDGSVWDETIKENENCYQNHSANLKVLLEESGKRYVLRGGSWGYSPIFCRSAIRYGYARDILSNSLGFRVCLVGAGLL
ncbi:SUMF1/EgtB/PvdO family nonheme iron enzyme [Oscillatoria acuminata]|uniref:Protein kinase domain-containing protein n=1 Tax=Oscillatoria acuminata PCC 6304 TaxID=56110 RepID=K9TQT8_9CYAN|nr:SUMF1/EgtB/PvdO family nonheme iron enzyme [Oscillatoria acuminata]AFY85217.1 hypothetical protein Oscil6304_5742 [Oscillatoria acuminata PCC 6304]